MKRAAGLGVLALLAVAAAAAWALAPWGPPAHTRFVGNSLTQDLLSPPDHDDPRDAPGPPVAPGFEELAGPGFTHEASIRWGRPLAAAAADPARGPGPGARAGGAAALVRTRARRRDRRGAGVHVRAGA